MPRLVSLVGPVPLAGAWVAPQARNFLMDLGDHAAQFTFLKVRRDMGG